MEILDKNKLNHSEEILKAKAILKLTHNMSVI